MTFVDDDAEPGQLSVEADGVQVALSSQKGDGKVEPVSASNTPFTTKVDLILPPSTSGGFDDLRICRQPEGCTRTLGYWKTRTTLGPAPYDDTWDSKTGGDAEFLGTGASYYEVLWTPPQGGNAFFILAHQYIAAEMNMLAGATMPSEVSSAHSAAKDLLTTYQGSMEIPKKTADRDLAISLADTLDDYNNGLIGPGHCDS